MKSNLGKLKFNFVGDVQVNGSQVINVGRVVPEELEIKIEMEAADGTIRQPKG